METRIDRYKGPVFVGGAMAAAALFALFGLVTADCPVTSTWGSAALWIMRAMASLSVHLLTQLLWHLHVESRPKRA